MGKVKKLLLEIAVTATCSLLMTISAQAAPFENQKFSFAQPDNTKVDVIGTGDEFYQHIETGDGYTLVRNEDGWICYAQLNEDGTELEATDVVYTGNNDNVPEYLEKHLEITQESVDKKVREAKEELQGENECALNKIAKPRTALRAAASEDEKIKVVGLTVLVDFPDQPGTISF